MRALSLPSASGLLDCGRGAPIDLPDQLAGAQGMRNGMTL